MSFKMSKDSEILYVGNTPPKEVFEPDAPPIWLFSASRVVDMDDYDFASMGGRYYYNRSESPNRDMLAEAISFLENGEASYLCSSGMAAISSALIGLLKAGDHVLTSKNIYGETILLLEEVLGRYGVITDFADFTDADDIRAHLTPETKILYTEVVSNPLIRITDIDMVSSIAKEVGALTLVDNTFSTPFAIKPLDHGADVVIHSLTKFFGGHSDVTGGSITASKEILDKIMLPYLFLGGIMDPFSSWLELRSVRTMKLRVEKQMQNAIKLAEALDKDPRIDHVNYPTLEYHPEHELAKTMLPKGSGPMLSFELVNDDRDKVNEFIRSLSMIQYLGTLGGYRTSLAHPATAFRAEFTPEELKAMGLTEGLIRISVGTEEIEDIIGDITNALKVFD